MELGFLFKANLSSVPPVNFFQADIVINGTFKFLKSGRLS